jgi:hypothetical protein
MGIASEISGAKAASLHKFIGIQTKQNNKTNMHHPYVKPVNWVERNTLPCLVTVKF